MAQESKREEARRKEARLRRMAVQIATQLPEDPDDALAIVAYMQELLVDFLTVRGEPPRAATHLSVVEEFPKRD